MSGLAVETLDAAVYPALYSDLTERPEKVAPFFPLPPSDPGAWCRRAEAVAPLWRDEAGVARRRGLVGALGAYHERLGVHPAQRRNLEALARSDALVVVTGQQAGLFGGPLFTLYKALGAVVRAAEAERALGSPVVPVFWIASDDHDWSEVSVAELPAPDGSLVRLRLPGSGDFRSAGHIPVPPEARRLVGELTALHPPQGDGAQVAADLLEGLRRPGRLTLADWFAGQLHRLLAPHGVLFYDPMQPGLRALAAPIFAGAAERAARANAAIAAAGRALRDAGYTPGLDIDPDHVHLFTYVEGRRVALHAQDGRIRTRDGQVDVTPAELAAKAQAAPSGFSPNVALRPIVQDFTLPVLCQLAGPGEVAYLAQLGEVFGLWDRPVPIVCPRAGATLVLPEDLEAVGRAGARLEELRDGPQEVIDRFVAARSPVDLDAVFEEQRRFLGERYSALEQALTPAVPSLKAVIRGNGERVSRQLDYLERKARQHLRRSQRDLVSGLRAAVGRLFPEGGLQERHSVAYPYLFRYGLGLIEEVRAAIAGAPGPLGRHLLLVRRAGD